MKSVSITRFINLTNDSPPPPTMFHRTVSFLMFDTWKYGFSFQSKEVRILVTESLIYNAICLTNIKYLFRKLFQV